MREPGGRACRHDEGQRDDHPELGAVLLLHREGARGAGAGGGGGALEDVDGAATGFGVDGGGSARGDEGAPSSSSSSAARFPAVTPIGSEGRDPSASGFWPTAISSIHDPTSTNEPATAGGLSGPVMVDVSIGFAAAPPGAALSSVREVNSRSASSMSLSMMLACIGRWRERSLRAPCTSCEMSNVLTGTPCLNMNFESSRPSSRAVR
jgi:hypothetical protein